MYMLRLFRGSAETRDPRLKHKMKTVKLLGHANITTTSRYLRSTPVRLAQALERIEAFAETVVDADDQPHRAAASRHSIEPALDQR